MPKWCICVCGCEMFDLMEKKRVFMTIDNSCAKLYLTNADGNLWSVAAVMLGRNRSRWSMSLQVQTSDWTDKLNSEQHEDELSELRTSGFGAMQSSPVLGWTELTKCIMSEREICVTFFKCGNLCTMRWRNTYFKAAPQTYFSMCSVMEKSQEFRQDVINNNGPSHVLFMLEDNVQVSGSVQELKPQTFCRCCLKLVGQFQ